MTIEEFIKFGSDDKMFNFRGLTLRVKNLELSPGVIVKSSIGYYCEAAISVVFDVINARHTTLEVYECPLKEFETEWLADLSVAE